MSLLSRFKRVFYRTSIENPSTDLASESVWQALFGNGNASDAGISVNTRVALTCSAIWRGTNLVANTVAKLPCYVVDPDQVRDPLHHAARLINRRAAAEYSAFHFQQTLTFFAILRGNGYAWIRRRDGIPVELLILNPDTTYPIRQDGQLYYVTSVAGELRLLWPHEVLHIHGLSSDGLVGESLITLATDDIGTEVAHRKVDARWFRNPTPPFTLETPNSLSDVAYARIKADFHKIKPGLDDSHKPAILEEGLKANPLLLKPSDLQAIEQKRFRLSVFANWIGLPPHKLGAEGKSAYASLEQENQSLRDDTYDPWLVIWEDEFQEKLLTETEKATGSRAIEYDREALDRVNSEAKGKFFSAALAGGPWMLQNEVRRKQGLPPVPGGNVMKWPGNIAPTGKQEPKSDDSTDDQKKEPTDDEN